MLEVITYGFDTILLVSGATSAIVAWRALRGRWSTGIALAALGLVLLGLAHLSETLLGTVFGFVGEGPPEIVHRVLVLLGFTWLVCGMVATGGELRRDRASLHASYQSLRETDAELRAANEELRERNRQLLLARASAITDGLTGIYNHRAFQERVRAELDEADRAQSCFGLVMLDLDGFKKVNDTLGHLEGDRILQEVAQSIPHFATVETVYRYGGDEFVVLLPGADDACAAAIAEAIRCGLESRLADAGVTVSLGYSSYPGSAGTVEEVIYGADSAMYRAKAAGKNRVAGPEVNASVTTAAT